MDHDTIYHTLQRFPSVEPRTVNSCPSVMLTKELYFQFVSNELFIKALSQNDTL